MPPCDTYNAPNLLTHAYCRRRGSDIGHLISTPAPKMDSTARPLQRAGVWSFSSYCAIKRRYKRVVMLVIVKRTQNIHHKPHGTGKRLYLLSWQTNRSRIIPASQNGDAFAANTRRQCACISVRNGISRNKDEDDLRAPDNLVIADLAPLKQPHQLQSQGTALTAVFRATGKTNAQPCGQPLSNETAARKLGAQLAPNTRDFAGIVSQTVRSLGTCDLIATMETITLEISFAVVSDNTLPKDLDV
ncbi:hypothetical protein GEV33_008032 [Tenebrio molitor]|uniref:Uncharacterized protein n=1 Tax=Tenebrio molitor TaxID=7067 RepID=A0A8J6HHI1_TENMO|nr:hypothetical protein GEV33_008032 [Tenebrio molitor]